MTFDINRQAASPLKVPRSRRNHDISVLTSMPAGKVTPIAAIPMFREDGCRGRVTINVEMLETKELLMNPVNLRVTAYCVPFLALERFEGSRDMLDRSYMGQPKVAGGVTVPFIETQAFGAHGANAVYKYLGMHGAPTDVPNTMYLEAYNTIWNFRARNRSPEITPRARLATTLAPAFWMSSRFQHVVPDFDQAVIDGEVALNVVDGRMPVHGLGVSNSSVSGAGAANIRDVDGNGEFYAHTYAPPPGGPHQFFMRADGVNGAPDVFAELAENGVTVSLSNLEMAKRTQAFAKLREQFLGHDEDWIIDMLMDGLTIPDQALKQPILIADQVARFGQMKRYATDAGNLDESAVSGAAALSINLRVPRLHTGGVIMVCAEALPEQLFERQYDPFMYWGSNSAWPEFVRDSLDPEKVDVIRNNQIDASHAAPAATFGYVPLNWQWNSFPPRVGGKFYRPTANTATDDARQRLWAVENVDPVLSEDFYLATDMHQKPFLDLAVDPFEVTAVGNAVLDGNTVFGGMLVENTTNYDEVAAQAPTDRIDKD